MSSGFVSGGTVDAPIERSDEWLAAQTEIEANRQRKLDEQARQSDGRGLYETLEANKVAKQEAFEEANRLKNQFRALNEDEVEYLDSVLESTRAEEARVKKETAEGLALFRKQQEEADKRARRGSEGEPAEEGSSIANEESWVAGGKKRKRVKEKEKLKGVKIRRTSTADEHIGQASPTQSEAAAAIKTVDSVKAAEKMEPSTTKPKPEESKKGLGLVSYDSDSDND